MVSLNSTSKALESLVEAQQLGVEDDDNGNDNESDDQVEDQSNVQHNDENNLQEDHSPFILSFSLSMVTTLWLTYDLL